VLRGIGQEDLAEVLPISVYDGRQAHSEEDARWMLEQIAADYRQGTSIHWGLFLPDTYTLVGSCGFYRGFAQETGELGYILKAGYRGRGFMREAATAIVRFGFTGLGLRRIVAYTDSDNEASIGVLRAVGFTEELPPPAGSRKFGLAPPLA